MDERRFQQNQVILITGASGFTGGHACRYFATEMGMRVAALVRKEENLPAIDGVQYYSCDLHDEQRLRAIVKEIAPDYVLHLGGKNSVSESWEMPLTYLESNVMSTLYLLDALRFFPSCRILIVGSRLSFQLSTSSYRSPHPYSLSKSLQKIVSRSWKELFGQSIILAEPSNLIGPGPSTGFCSLLARRVVQVEQGGTREPFRVSPRNDRRDFLDVRDAVEAYGLLLNKGVRGEVYPICSGTERSLEEVTKMILTISGSDLAVIWGEGNPHAEVTKSAPIRADFIESLGWNARIPSMVSLTDVIHYFRNLQGGVS